MWYIVNEKFDLVIVSLCQHALSLPNLTSTTTLAHNKLWLQFFCSRLKNENYGKASLEMEVMDMLNVQVRMITLFFHALIVLHLEENAIAHFLEEGRIC